jgi:putative toxin-antitoxin system antitoxin component (TIGR02293 family)
MHKTKKPKAKLSNYSHTEKMSKVHEPFLGYAQPQFMPIVKDFDYKEFKKIADKVPFTQKEWSDILHISERTLQRYAKDNGVFNFSVVDRILQIDKVIKRGIEVFGNRDKFINWLRINPPALEGRISLYSLASFEGINLILIQLVRIEHGILA